MRKNHLPEERDHSDKQLIYIQLRFGAKEGRQWTAKTEGYVNNIPETRMGRFR